jgi:hypothetical protein
MLSVLFRTENVNQFAKIEPTLNLSSFANWIGASTEREDVVARQ